MSYGREVFSTATLEDGTSIVEALGEIDSSSAPALQEALLLALAEGHERVVLDLSDVSFMDSSGIGAVMAGYAEARARQAPFAVVCADSYPAQRIRAMGLDAVLEVFPTRDRALERVRTG